MKQRFLLFWVLFSVLIGGFVAVASATELSPADVRVVGLFKGSAVIVVRGKQTVLKEGQTTAGGVRLVQSRTSSAVVEIAGVEHEIPLGRALGSYQKPSQAKVTIAMTGAGQYLTQGSINGQPVQLLVDTGATAVAMNTRAARRLGINFAAGQEGRVSTAGGIVKSYSVILDAVKVGDIEVKHVRAAVLEGLYPTDVLLGMTFLGEVKIVESAGIMELSKNY